MSQPWSPVRVPAFWIMLVINGLVGLAAAGIAAVLAFSTPRAAVVTVPLVAAYVTVWLAVVVRAADPAERRPAWLVGAAVGWGATVACAIGIGAGVYLDNVVAKAISPAFAAEWGPALVAPTAEETAKAAGVVLLLLAARPYLATVWSGAVYGALVGVGFALTEDAGYALSYADQALPDDATAAAQVLLLRFTTPGLIGHPVFTAVAGAGIAYAWLRRDVPAARRAGVLTGALAAAWVMHFVVNSPLAAAAAGALGDLGWIAGWVGYVLATTVPALPALYWLAAVRREDARALLGRASAVLPDLVPAADVPVLTRLWTRMGADRRLRRASGRAAVRAARRLRRAQFELAAALAQPYRGYPAAAPGWLAPPVQRRCWQVARARAELAGLAGTDPPPPTDQGPSRRSRTKAHALIFNRVHSSLIGRKSLDRPEPGDSPRSGDRPEVW